MSKLIRMFSDYTDENGYPGTIDYRGNYDGGDTAAIIGTLMALEADYIGPGIPGIPIPTRHVDDTKWYGQSDRFSRDQLIPCICGIINEHNDTFKPTHWLYIQHKKKYFLTAWNTKGNGAMDMPTKFPDICGPEVWALWLRYRQPWWARAVLWLLDVQTLIGAIQWRWFTSETNQVTRNHMLVSITCKRVMPTITSRLANYINDYKDLTDRWQKCNEVVGEYPTWQLFKKELGLQF